MSNHLRSGWSNFRNQPSVLQGLVWVFALPVAIFLWASSRSTHRPVAFSFAALITVGCLGLPFIPTPDEESVQTTAASDQSSEQTQTAQASKPSLTTSTTTTRATTTTTASTTTTSIPLTSAPSPSPSTAAPLAVTPAPSPPADIPRNVTGTAAQILSQLSLREETSDEGYDRDLFNHWIDANGDGCTTRCEVLRLERRPTLPGLSSGGWLSLYDGQVTADPSEFDIDHVVALAEAWRSGASEWDGARRQEFANDLEEPRSLIAVTAGSNRSKSDRDPSSWQPTDKSYWCEYVTAWMAVKLRWGLAVDPIEFTALQGIIESC